MYVYAIVEYFSNISKNIYIITPTIKILLLAVKFLEDYNISYGYNNIIQH